jgi:tRNA threonylcarbamoyladenosine biosynthesis protein TsaE
MILADEQATADLGLAIARQVRAGDVITLSGPLGVGKTALARSILHALGHEGEVPSPTFAIVQPYELLDPPAWHVDLYRIEDAAEIEELGLDAAEEGLLLIEWPERAGEGTFGEALRLNLEFDAGGARRLTADVPPSWEGRWPT